MWSELVKHLAKFPNAVLTGVDPDGYPFSLRCTPLVDESRQVLRISQTGDGHIQPGPAELLCHFHNDQLWELKAILIFGSLEQAEPGWIFHPERFVPGGSLLGLIGQMRDLFKCRAEAGKYLQKRGLSRPKVDWKEIKALRDEAQRLNSSS